jgi:hypothetical protein
MKMLTRVARGIAHPERIFRRLLRLVPKLPPHIKVELDLYDRPQYAYGLSQAAKQAEALGISAVSCVEFGVGSGQGLRSLELIAGDIEASTRVKINVFGFDTGVGLPEPHDFRDIPYLYRGGFYPMDEVKLRSTLSRARLILGDVAQTVPTFLADTSFAPIGFIAFDLDYYSSTIRALDIFDGEFANYLPRVICYFDDISNAEALQCDYTGEMQALSDFNDRHSDVKIDRVAGLAASRPISSPWNDQTFACHFFGHPAYNTHIMPEAERYVRRLGTT